nr:HEPN domain-containing protein [Pseudodesulfovibrio sp.]
MEFLKQYEILYKKARTDLKVAKNLLEDFENGDEELDMEVIMFHLQQSVEKLLKSLLAYNKLHFTKTHSIEYLLDAITQNSIEIIQDTNKLIPLSEFAVEGRYAIIHDDIDNADEYIVIIDGLIEFVKAKVSH